MNGTGHVFAILSEFYVWARLVFVNVKTDGHVLSKRRLI